VKLVGAALFVGLFALVASGCGGQSSAAGGQSRAAGSRSSAAVSKHAARVSAATVPRYPPAAPVVIAPGQPAPAWKQVATIGALPAAWIMERSGVTLMRFDQRLVHLALHAGSGEPGGGGWSYGDVIGRREIHRVVAAFNGGFKLSYGSVGFMADGRVAVPLAAGLGSIVTYREGTTQIGAWRAGVPARGRKIASVLQNLHLLVDHGEPAHNLETCATGCWGLTLGGGVDVARSALGIAGDGQLIWAAGEGLSPARIANALTSAGVQRAVQLDINPEWVAGYLYIHHAGGPTAVAVVPGQVGIPGRLLEPYARDFFTVLSN
jgi:hypothetical protein